MASVMDLCSSAIRGVIISPHGKKLVIADLSNIEGRVLAWLAGETWKLKAFRDFDAGTGHDLYKLAYAKSFGVKPDEVTKDQRQVGKVQELALGYQGGVGAFLTFALAYNIDLEAMGGSAIEFIPAEIAREADEFRLWQQKQGRSQFGLTDTAFVVCDSFKRLWREAHPAVASWWKEVEEICKCAILNPGETYTTRRIKVRRDGAWLRVMLPSGRYLCYPQPRIVDDKITYMGINQYSRKWQRLSTYGGKIVENITQGCARDVLAHSMPLIEQADYEIVLTVHDEIIAEAPDTEEFSAEQLAALMSSPPEWAQELPLAAAGFETYRYRKE
jgi:DNA polymerase bacteriophage-type